MDYTYFQWSITFICIQNWKGSPKPQRNVNPKGVVDDDADNEENGRTSKNKSNGKDDVWICSNKLNIISITLTWNEKWLRFYLHLSKEMLALYSIAIFCSLKLKSGLSSAPNTAILSSWLNKGWT